MADSKDKIDSFAQLFGASDDLKESASRDRMGSVVLLGLYIFAGVIALLCLIGLLRGYSHPILMLLGIGAMILDAFLCRNYVGSGTLGLLNPKFTNHGRVTLLLGPAALLLALASSFCPAQKKTSAMSELLQTGNYSAVPGEKDNHPEPAAPAGPVKNYCSICGQQLPATAKSCSHSGTALTRFRSAANS